MLRKRMIVATVPMLILTMFVAYKKLDTGMFSDISDLDEFQDIPILTSANGVIGTVKKSRNEYFSIDIQGIEKKEYVSYLKDLCKHGFKVHSENEIEQTGQYILTTSLMKGKQYVTTSYVVNTKTMFISVSKKMRFSNHLISTSKSTHYVYDYTALHMLELNSNGASFVIQLKNGHFIIHDGGRECDAPYLVDYLEKLVKRGEKPVIEGWFISHAHKDHLGALAKIIDDTKLRERIFVDEIYFAEPSNTFMNATTFDSYREMNTVMYKYSDLLGEDGEECEIYRPQLGQRYYFQDVYIDVCFTPDQFVIESGEKVDFNDSSAWFMNGIEGQKILMVGDANIESMRQAIVFYNKEYFEVDVYAVAHHGVNVYDLFTNFITVKTLLYTNWRVGSLWQDGSKYERKKENENLVASAKEAYSNENGIVELHFPYKTGQAIIHGPTKWLYNGGRQVEIFK